MILQISLLMVSLIVGYGGRRFFSLHQLRIQQKKLRLKNESKSQEDEKRRQRQLHSLSGDIQRERKSFEHEFQRRQHTTRKIEEKLQLKQTSLNEEEKKYADLKAQVQQEETLLNEEETKIKEAEAKYQNLKEQEIAALLNVYGQSREEVKQALLKRIEKEVQREQDEVLRKKLLEQKELAVWEAHRIMEKAMQKTNVFHLSEATLTRIPLPSEDVKGKIIGKEGRNIKAFEQCTGVDMVIDELPGVILLQSSDACRREIASRALKILMQDGRINPERIQEVVEKVKEQQDDLMVDIGEETLFDLGIQRIPPELVKKLGELKFCCQKGQNMMAHLRECIYLITAIAAELGEDVGTAKRAAFFHDLKKSFEWTEEQKKQFELESNETVWQKLSETVDLLSTSRPGACSEKIQNYFHRIEKIEDLVRLFKGVQHCYCVQTGREVRVFVNPKEVSDEQSQELAQQIALKIKDNFSGQYKVVVIRESRCVEYTK